MPTLPQQVPADNSTTIGNTPVPDPTPQPAPSTDGQTTTAQTTAPTQQSTNHKTRKFGSDSQTATSGIPPILHIVKQLSFYTIQDHRVNWFVPSYLNASAIIIEMNRTISSTDRFLRNAPQWLPAMTHLYIGVLFFVQAIEAAIEGDTASDEQVMFLADFKSHLDTRSLMIPGPLVPAFIALQATSGPYEWLGNITPRIPHNLQCTDTTGFVMPNLHRHLPNVPYFMDILQHVIATAAPANFAALLVANERRTSIFQEPAAAAAASRVNLESPGALEQISYTINQWEAANATLNYIDFPARLNATAATGNPISIYEYLRFHEMGTQTTNYNWFANVAAVMQRYCQFFSHSASLSTFSANGPSSGPIVSTMSAGNNNLITPYTFVPAVVAPAAPAHYTLNRLRSIRLSISHSKPTLEEIIEQMSGVANINVDYTGSGVVLNLLPHRNGAYWQLAKVRQSPPIDIISSIAPNIALYYHQDARTYN